MGSLWVLGFVGAKVDCRCFLAPSKDLPGKCVPVLVAGGCGIVAVCDGLVAGSVGSVTVVCCSLGSGCCAVLVALKRSLVPRGSAIGDISMVDVPSDGAGEVVECG